jgi:hypothetical protein
LYIIRPALFTAVGFPGSLTFAEENSAELEEEKMKRS